MNMPIEMQVKLMKVFETFMQVSILIPMAITWRRWQYFSKPIKLASWYVYLSAISVISGKLAAHYFHNNLLIAVAFNVAKLLLFAAVYAKVLEHTRWYSLLRVLLPFSLSIIAGLLFSDWVAAVSVARMTQSTMLAAFALAYLDQTLNLTPRLLNNRDPMWLISVGNLLQAAGAITAASANLNIFNRSPYKEQVCFVFIAFSSLVFNCFLSMAFLRAQPAEAVLPDADISSATTLANA